MKARFCVPNEVRKIKELETEIEKVVSERDAAIADLIVLAHDAIAGGTAPCELCKHDCDWCEHDYDPENFEWRGKRGLNMKAKQCLSPEMKERIDLEVKSALKELEPLAMRRLMKILLYTMHTGMGFGRVRLNRAYEAMETHRQLVIFAVLEKGKAKNEKNDSALCRHYCWSNYLNNHHVYHNKQ